MRLLIVSCSKNAYELGERLKKEWAKAEPSLFAEHIVKTKMLPELSLEGKMEPYVQAHFTEFDAILFICAAGIAVRAIAPVVKHKSLDPAVLILDERAKHCISLLSGHAGGANRYALQIAALTGADPVITTASDLEEKFAVDVFARENDLIVANWQTAKFIAVQILSGKPVFFLSDHPVEGTMPEELVPFHGQNEGMYIHITDRKEEAGNDRCLKLIVPDLVLGIGCRKGTPFAQIEEAVQQFLKETGFDRRAICKLSSIDLKAEEEGLLEFAKKHRIPFSVYRAEELSALQGDFSESAFVEKVTGVSGVCERAAVMDGADLIVKKTCYPQVTLALAKKNHSIRF